MIKEALNITKTGKFDPENIIGMEFKEEDRTLNLTIDLGASTLQTKKDDKVDMKVDDQPEVKQEVVESETTEVENGDEAPVVNTNIPKKATKAATDEQWARDWNLWVTGTQSEKNKLKTKWKNELEGHTTLDTPVKTEDGKIHFTEETLNQQPEQPQVPAADISPEYELQMLKMKDTLTDWDRDRIEVLELLIKGNNDAQMGVIPNEAHAVAPTVPNTPVTNPAPTPQGIAVPNPVPNTISTPQPAANTIPTPGNPIPVPTPQV